MFTSCVHSFAQTPVVSQLFCLGGISMKSRTIAPTVNTPASYFLNCLVWQNLRPELSIIPKQQQHCALCFIGVDLTIYLKASMIGSSCLQNSHQNFNSLYFEWFKKLLLSTNSPGNCKLLSDSFLLDSSITIGKSNSEQ